MLGSLVARTSALLCLSIAACNTAPVDYRDLGQAPGRGGNWMEPTEWCEGRRFQAEDDVVIDGFLLCTAEIRVRPVDDPILHDCQSDRVAALRPSDEVVWVYDGGIAKAYLLEALELREGVHDDLRGVPVFVDF